MSNIVKNYEKVLEVINTLELPINQQVKAGRKAKMSDIEVVALSLTAEYMSIDSENSLFKQLKSEPVANLIERSQYNKRRRKLFEFSELLRVQLYSRFNEFEDYFVIDSMPLEVCKMARHTRVKVCREIFETAPDKGFCASQNSWFFGYKLLGVCAVTGVFQSIDLTKVSVHDVHLLQGIKSQISDCVLLGYNGY